MDALHKELAASREQAAAQDRARAAVLSERDRLEHERAHVEKERDALGQQLQACENGLKQQLKLVQDERDELAAREAALVQKHQEDIAAAAAGAAQLVVLVCRARPSVKDFGLCIGVSVLG